jgi:broad specificity phosphatase PhoE
MHPEIRMETANPELILIRHAEPEIIPNRPASQWPLSEAGRLRCQTLADSLKAYDLDAVMSSTENKAIETGQIVAESLNKPFSTAEGLHEHERSNVTRFETRALFQERIAAFFREPERLVFGTETADEAYARFSRSLLNLVTQQPGQKLAIVTHGTVLTLFVARLGGLDPFDFWSKLGLPAFVVLRLSPFKIHETVMHLKP